MALTVAIQMDPVESFDITVDLTFRLGLKPRPEATACSTTCRATSR